MGEQKKLLERKKKKKALQKSQSYKKQDAVDRGGAPRSMRTANGSKYNIK